VRVNAPGNSGAKGTEVRTEDVEPVKLDEPAGYGRVWTATHPPRVREMSEECIAAAQIQESALIPVRGRSSATSVASFRAHRYTPDSSPPPMSSGTPFTSTSPTHRGLPNVVSAHPPRHLTF
jgi:hypothetical protein